MAWIKSKSEPANGAEPAEEAGPGPRPERRSATMQNSLGRTITVKGEVSGSEDLTIEGKVEGKILLVGHALTVGEKGEIKADVEAKSVVVAGKLTGNIEAADRVEVAASGTMLGDIRAPRVVLSDGASFRGSIDMEPRGKGAAERPAEKRPDASTKPAAKAAAPTPGRPPAPPAP
jgi:cytoskeletal protein CcmA (bactofilin family)